MSTQSTLRGFAGLTRNQGVKNPGHRMVHIKKQSGSQIKLGRMVGFRFDQAVLTIKLYRTLTSGAVALKVA